MQILYELLEEQTFLELGQTPPDNPVTHAVLRPKYDRNEVLVCCTLVLHEGVVIRKPPGQSQVVEAIALRDFSSERQAFIDVFVKKILLEMDKAGYLMVFCYTQHPERPAESDWRREPITQLRIRVKAPSDAPLQYCGTFPFTYNSLRQLWADDSERLKRYEEPVGFDHDKGANAMLVLEPTSAAGRQLSLSHSEIRGDERDQKRFVEQQKLGAIAMQKPGVPFRTWLSWIEDWRSGTLRVNRVVVGCRRGAAASLVGLLNHCIEKARVTDNFTEVVI